MPMHVGIRLKTFRKYMYFLKNYFPPGVIHAKYDTFTVACTS